MNKPHTTIRVVAVERRHTPPEVLFSEDYHIIFTLQVLRGHYGPEGRPYQEYGMPRKAVCLAELRQAASDTDPTNPYRAILAMAREAMAIQQEIDRRQELTYPRERSLAEVAPVYLDEDGSLWLSEQERGALLALSQGDGRFGWDTRQYEAGGQVWAPAVFAALRRAGYIASESLTQVGQWPSAGSAWRMMLSKLGLRRLAADYAGSGPQLRG